MSRFTDQLISPPSQPIKAQKSVGRRPFATLSNTPNKCISQDVKSAASDLPLTVPEVHETSNELDVLKIVDSYRKLYSSESINFDVARITFRTYKKKRHRNGDDGKCTLEDVALNCKALAAERYFSKYKTTGHVFVESGEFVVFEFFNVVLPLLSGSFDMCFQAFICTADEDNKTLDCDQLADFWCPVNRSCKKGSVQEVFLRRPSFKTTQSEIYLFVHCYGNVVNCQANPKLVNCVQGVGISRIGKWKPSPSYNSLLSAHLDFSARSVHIEQSRREKMDIRKLRNWLPNFETLDELRKKFLTKRERNLDNFLVMEMSNENGLGDFDEMDASIQTSLTSAKTPSRPSTSKNKHTINKYVFNLSSQPSSISTSSRQLKEDSIDRSSSSGYVSGCSTSSSSTGESVESNRSLNLSVDSNSCVICGLNFNKISDLLLHLETRYPSLKFSHDSVTVDQICVTIPTVMDSVSPKNDFLMLNRSLIRQYRRRILAKLNGLKIQKPVIPAPVVNETVEPLQPSGLPLSFNPPVYHKVSFPGFYGINRSSSWLSIYQSRKLKEFVDVTKNEMSMIKLWNDFQGTIRTVLLPQQIYGASVVFVSEFRDALLKPSVYPEFVVHLSNLKRVGYLRTAEFYDIISRLQHGSTYDPRTDTKHYVHIALKNLETQRAAYLENQKQNGIAKKTTLNGRDVPTTSNQSASNRNNKSNRKQKSTLSNRKRSLSNGNNSNNEICNKRPRTQPPVTSTEVEVEKKRQFKTQTPMSILLQKTVLKPGQVPISCFDDLACRYQFLPEKQLRPIWHFCQPWTRKFLE